jgi:hypothetical protein
LPVSADSLYIVDQNILADKFRRLYEGSAHTVVARDRISGQSVRFPASRLRNFVTAAGVTGSFELTVDRDNQLLSIRRINNGYA